MFPKISVIIPCHNNYDLVKNYILPALCNADEVVLVGNGMTSSETEKFSKLFEFDRVFYIDYSVASRPEARNNGSSFAHNEILLFIDGDSIPNVNISQYVKENLGAKQVLFGRRNEIANNDTIIENLNYLLHISKTNNNRFLLKWEEASSNCFACWKKDFIAVGGFDENYKGWGYEDTDLFYSFANKGFSLDYMPKIEVWHWSHFESFINKIKDARKNLEYFYSKYPEQKGNQELSARITALGNWLDKGAYFQSMFYGFNYYCGYGYRYNKYGFY